MNSSPPVVLLVEGDIIARAPLAQYLRECGFRVVEAFNAAEAKIALASPDLKIEVVLADIHAEGDGLALRNWMIANYPDVRVILAVSVDKTTDRAGALCNDGPALVKPYNHLLVREHIHRALAHRERTLLESSD